MALLFASCRRLSAQMCPVIRSSLSLKTSNTMNTTTRLMGHQPPVTMITKCTDLPFFTLLRGSCFRTGHGCQNLQTSISIRQYSTSGKRPFDINSAVATDTIVYSYSNARFYRMMTLFGIAQFLFWVNLAYFTDITFKRLEQDKHAFDTNTFSGKMLIFLSQYNLKISALCLMLANLVLFFSLLYPFRSVSRLLLLQGGENLKVTTYGHFGKTRDFTVPLNHVNFVQGRSSPGIQISMKVKGRWMYHLLDNRDGVFHEPQLYDHIVGLKRDLKAVK